MPELGARLVYSRSSKETAGYQSLLSNLEESVIRGESERRWDTNLQRVLQILVKTLDLALRMEILGML